MNTNTTVNTTSTSVPSNSDIPTVGHIFVVPNMAAKASDFFSPNNLREKVEAAGFTIGSEDELMVEVWAVSDQSSNWSCHSFKSGPRRGAYWTGYLPLSALKGKKEGVALQVVDPQGATVNLICQQQGFRYERAGTFEEAVAKVTQPRTRR